MNSLFNDPGGVKHPHLCKIYGLSPDYNAKEAGDAPSSAMKWCAQPEKGRYPTDTPERTVVSWCHASHDQSLKGNARAMVLDNIKEAADWWGVELPEKTKKVPSRVYTFKVATEEGEDTYEITGASDAEQYARLIVKRAADYSYDTRRQVAEGVLGAPDEMMSGVSPGSLADLEVAAGRAMVGATGMKAACDIRASYLEAAGLDDLGGELRRLGDMARGDFLSHAAVVKAASAIDLADRAAGLTAYFKDGTLLPAEHSMAGIPYSHVKKAADDALELNGGRITTKGTVLANRETVDGFFAKIAGEDTKGLDTQGLFARLTGMDELETDAFDDLTRLCM